MRLGAGEIIVIGVVLAIVFSASRMAALGNAIGKFVHSFKKASGGDGFIDAKPSARRLSDKAPVEDAQVVEDSHRKRGG